MKKQKKHGKSDSVTAHGRGKEKYCRKAIVPLVREGLNRQKKKQRNEKE